MRFIFIVFLLVGYHLASSQTLCNTILPQTKFGDYPPGCLMCFQSLDGNNIGYTPDDSIDYTFFCGEVENSRWYTFKTKNSIFIEVTLTIKSSKNGDGLEMGIFDENLIPATSCGSLKNVNSRIFRYSLKKEQKYHILIDGIDGDECEFRLTVNTDLDGGRGSIVASQENQICKEVEVCFEAESFYEGKYYRWETPPTDSIVSGGGLDDSEVCIYFKEGGRHQLKVEVESPCGQIENLQKSLLIHDLPQLIIDSIYNVNPQYCIKDTVEFYLNWTNEYNVGLFWSGYLAAFNKIDGATTDTFIRGVLVRQDTIELSVDPTHVCGLKYSQMIPITPNPTAIVRDTICANECFQFLDSCYATAGVHFIDTGLKNYLGCDSIVRLNLVDLGIVSSPIIYCQPISNGILFSWQVLYGIDNYRVFVNRDSFTTTTDNSLLLENIAKDSSVSIKIQPIGRCDYLPGEVVCTNTFVSTNNHFIENEILIIPNPTTGKINIETDLKIESIEVFDLTGRFLQKEKTPSFELENRNSGIYFLKIKTENEIVVKRILLN